MHTVLSNGPSVCYMIPHILEDKKHFPHLPRFLAKLGNLANVYVIVEKGSPWYPSRNMRAVHWKRCGILKRILRSIKLVVLAIRGHSICWIPVDGAGVCSSRVGTYFDYGRSGTTERILFLTGVIFRAS